jgi:glycosyltransferase involved in cell wall biosynthesis
MGAFLKWALTQKKIKKKIALFLYQKFILINADAVHVTSQYELDSLKAIDNRINGIIIEHGIIKKKHKSKKFFQKQKKAIFFSRVHKKKGIDILLKAWTSINTHNWQLDIYGPEEDSFLKNFIKQYNPININYHGPVYNLEKKKKIFYESDLFILPTFEENFGLAILEAFMFKVPVITTENSAFGNIEKKKLGWICQPELESLKKKLKIVLKTKKKIFKKFANAAFKYSDNYQATKIVKKHLNLYLKVYQNEN